MFMELVTWVEGSDVYQCWFNKKKFIKILNSLGISDWKFFSKRSEGTGRNVEIFRGTVYGIWAL